MDPKDFLSTKLVYKKIKQQGFKFYCVGCNRERRQALPARLGSVEFFVHILITTAFYPSFLGTGFTGRAFLLF